MAATSFIAAVSNEPPDAVAALVDRALEPGDRTPEPTAYPVFAPTTFALLWSGRHEPLRATLDAALSQARATGDGVLLSIALTRRAWLGLRSGELVAAEADARAALQAAELPAPRLNRVLAASLLVDALVEQGRTAEAEAALEPWHGEAGSSSMAAAVLRSARAHLLLAQHRPAEALLDLTAAGDVATRALAPAPELPALALGRSARPARAGGPRRGRAPGRRGARPGPASGAPRALGVALRVAGAVRRRLAGRTLLRRRWRRSAAPATRSSAPARWPRSARWCAAPTGAREARELLLEAVDVARAAGALPLAGAGRDRPRRNRGEGALRTCSAASRR